jgi:SAM-dependent methyltransferase
VLCVNILEYVEDPTAVVRSLRTALKPNGVLVVLAPQGPGLFGSLDRRLGHRRRYRASEARQLLEAEGLTVETLYQFNKAGTPPWWMYGRIFGSGKINKAVLKIFDKTVWLWSRIDRLLPWRGLSLIVVARNPVGRATADTPERMQTTRGSSRE